MGSGPPVVALTQGDPAGVGPEILLKLAGGDHGGYRPLLLAERAALEAQAAPVLSAVRDRLEFLPMPSSPEKLELPAGDRIAVVDPLADGREVTPGESGPTDAVGALEALDLGIDLARAGIVDALVTAPVSKISIARHERPGFRGHTDHLAAACGLERYGRDYLMAFLAPDLQVALVAPAVALAREQGIDAYGPESPDALFSRARRGEFDWVLALYHDQGLIAVKTVAFGSAVNWTLGLPFIRTSVDHGTAFAIAGSGEADAAPLARAVQGAIALAGRELPRGRRDRP